MSGIIDNGKRSSFSGFVFGTARPDSKSMQDPTRASSAGGEGAYESLELQERHGGVSAEYDPSMLAAHQTPDAPSSEGLLLAETQGDGFPWYFQPTGPHSSDSLQGFRQDASGAWPIGVKVALFLVASILILNASVTLWASVTFQSDGGIGTLHIGPCAQVERTGTVVHIIINFIGTLLLGASNFCMQCLTSPTRKEVDSEHAQKKWLEVGILSLRNLRVIGKSRVWLWFLLGMSSFPIHLMYNSAVFVNLTANEYMVAAVTPDFLLGGNWSYPYGDPGDIAILQALQQNATTYEWLDPADCIRAYGVDFLSGRRHVLAVTQDGQPNNSLIGVLDWSYNTIQNSWVCGVNVSANMILQPQPIDDFDCTIPDALESMPIPIVNDTLDHCLSEQVLDECRLQFSLPIMFIVIFCNCMKLFCILAALMKKHTTLVTLGDAVASFLEFPDPTTKGMCTVTMKEIQAGNWSEYPEPKPWVYHRYWRWQAAGLWRWVGSNAFAFLTLGLFAVLFYEAINITTTDPDLATWWYLGFGTATASSLVRWPTPLLGQSGLLKNVLLANLPQLLLTALYLVYNTAFTCMSFADEWARYFAAHLPLRTTRPRGAQRPTGFLTLPYHYVAPLLAVSAGAHFLLSQGMFLVAVDVFDFEGDVDPTQTILTVGFSVAALIILAFVLGLAVLVSAALGWRRYARGMPLVGPCTAAISAACHVASGENGWESAGRMVQWGVVETRDAVGHLSFSALPVGEPVPGRLYM